MVILKSIHNLNNIVIILRSYITIKNIISLFTYNKHVVCKNT